MPPPDPFVSLLEEWVEVFMRRSMRNFIRYSKERGLTMPQLGAMFHIQRTGCCGVTEIGADLGVTSAAASQLLDRLVHQQLIARSEDPVDRRVKQICLTGAGRQVVQESMRARQGWIYDLAGQLSAEEKDQVIAALQILIDKIARLELQPDRAS